MSNIRSASTSRRPSHHHYYNHHQLRSAASNNSQRAQPSPSFAEIQLSRRCERLSRQSPPQSRFTFLCHQIVYILGVQQHSRDLGGDGKTAEIQSPRLDSFVAHVKPSDLPKRSRITSTMSAEARYVALRGYEDIIREELEKKTEAAAETFVDNSDGNRLQSVNSGLISAPLTPIIPLRTTPRTPHFIPNQQQQSQHLSPHIYFQFGYNSTENCSGRSSPTGQPHSCSAEDASYRDSPVLTPPPQSEIVFESSRLGEDQDQESRLKRCMLHSYRLENAMEIVDCLREQRGEIIHSKRHRRHDIQPSEHFKIWSREWRKEFGFESMT